MAEVDKEVQEKISSFFIQFLNKYRDPGAAVVDENGVSTDPYYVSQARRMKEQDYRTLFVKFGHIYDIVNQVEEDEELDFDPYDLSDVIQKYYLAMRSTLQNAVQVFLTSITSETDPRAAEEIRQWAGSHTNVQLAFYNMPSAHSLRDLRMAMHGQLVTIYGTVTRTTEAKPELIFATFECPDCGRIIPRVEQQFKYTEPNKCPNRQCLNQSGFILKPHACSFADWQKIRVQEHANDIPAGSVPRSTDVIVRGEIVDRCKPGDKVVVTGTLIVVPDVPSITKQANLPKGVQGLKVLGVRELNYKTCFLGCFIESDTTETRNTGDDGSNIFVDIRGGDEGAANETIAYASGGGDQFYLNTREKERLNEIRDHPMGVFNVLAGAIAPTVFGHEVIKKGILLMLTGGVQKETADGLKLRGDMNICIVGDPSTAKSQFLKFTAGFLPRAVYASGKSSTAAGLTASVVRDPEISDVVIEPGALMLSDNGVCCIDEFDKMDLKDQVAIHEAMEQQTITLAKAGIQAQMNERASILAAANPRFGRYDLSKTLAQNVEISQPLMSRFDLFFVVVDELNVGEDRRVAEYLVDLHKNLDTGVRQEVSTKEIQQYIRVCRKIMPSISNEARARICKYYVQMRQNEKGISRKAFCITVRQLESIIRLSEAIARIHWSEEVGPEHVEMAFDLIKASLCKIDQGRIVF